ncbi:hypothetical protein [Halorussus sp. MSC15.2]|uniref:hypothetical protein n=1 Tax=Halorussus sp. MSC15.2 TaxID=2283638 RepID=UPI0013D6B59D|nr:hypothetical protein [Halorussus sp. MSC15.2]NEU58592.1 hypothetical protein [Halorussus sp. MSC15.2]
MSDIPALVREYVTEELRGVYTVSMVVVESVQEEARRCTVSLKRDDNVIVDDVPIASVFASTRKTPDGEKSYGQIVPIQQGDEGFVLHTKEPLEDLLVQRGHQDIGYTQRQFAPEDAVFFPCVWNEQDTLPDHDSDEYLVAHADSVLRIKSDGTVRLADENGQQFTIDPAANETTISHPAGPTLRVGADGIDVEGQVTIGDPNSTTSVAVQNHTHDVTLSDGTTTTTSSPNETGTDTQIS